MNNKMLWIFLSINNGYSDFICFICLQFYHLLQHNEAAKSTIEHRGVTVFAPTNRAFQKYAVSNDHGDLVLYHMCKYLT